MKYGTRRMEMTKTGPNDARRVVWAIGKFFYISFVFFQTLTTLVYEYVTGETETTRNGPK